jgi:hypothetical protein
MEVATCKHRRVSPLLVLLHGRLWNCAETLYSLSQGDLEYRWQVARLEWQSSDVSSAICAMWCNRVLDRSPMGHRDLDGWKHFTAFSIRLDHFGFCTFFLNAIWHIEKEIACKLVRANQISRANLRGRRRGFANWRANLGARCVGLRWFECKLVRGIANVPMKLLWGGCEISFCVGRPFKIKKRVVVPNGM